MPLPPRSSLATVLGMMRSKGRISDQFITALAVWIVAFSAIIPSLDRALLGSDVAIGSEHHEGCTHPRHDHTICIQFGKQGWTSGPSLPLQAFPPVAGEAVSVGHDVPAEFLRLVPTHSRAPPDTT